jgi:hypothetical protein
MKNFILSALLGISSAQKIVDRPVKDTVCQDLLDAGSFERSIIADEDLTED